MATCGEKHPEHAVPCEAEEGPGGSRHVGRHYSTYPYREWGEFVKRPVCGAAHASGATCGKDAGHERDESPTAPWHGVNLGGGWLAWAEGREDRCSFQESRVEGNRKAEAEDSARYAWERGEDVTEGLRFDTERWR